MMNIDELNSELERLSKQQTLLIEEIEDIKKEKITIKNEFLNTKLENLERFEDLSRDIDLFLDNNPIWSLKDDLEKLYRLAFHGIVHGRIETSIKMPDTVKGTEMEDNLWINSRGLAFKPNDDFWRWTYRERNNATKCIGNFDSIFLLIKDYPKIENSIKKQDKKEIFRAFHKCFKKWKPIQVYRLKITQDIKGIDGKSGYDTGLKDISIKELNTIEVELERSLGFRFTDGSHWSTFSSCSIYNINDKEDGMSLENKFLLSQISDENFQKILDYVNKYKDLVKHNKKLLNELRVEISPHIMHRMV